MSGAPPGPPPAEASAPVRGAWILGTALAYAAEEDTPVAAAVDALVAEAHGHAAALRAAYAGGLALAAELPDDRAARHTVDLLTHALHDAAVRRGGATT